MLKKYCIILQMLPLRKTTLRHKQAERSQEEPLFDKVTHPKITHGLIIVSPKTKTVRN